MAALAALALYLPSLGHGFVRDDFPLIVENVLMRAPDGLWRLISGDFLASTGFTSGLWRPLPLLAFWIEGRLGGWEPALFHATGILLHAVATLLVGALLTQAGLPRLPALLGALWFATLPAHVEPVAWISGQIDLLCACFALLALWLDRRARQAGRSWPGWAPPVALACALLSKEAAAGWFVVIAVAEWSRLRNAPEGGGQALRWVGVYVVVTLAWLIAHAAASGPGAVPGYVDEVLRMRRHAAGWVMLPQYLAFLWPWFPHASDVALWLPARPQSWPVLGGSLVTLASLGATAWLTFRRSSLAIPAVIVLVPVIPQITVALARGFLSSGERMMFLPSVGIAWLAAAGVGWCGRRRPGVRRIALGAMVALILGGAIETVRLQPMWRDDEQVFRGVTQRQPGNPVGWVGLAEVHLKAGRRSEAEQALDRASALDSRLPSVPMARAEIHYRAGEWEQVVTHASRALGLEPDLFPARLLRASTLVRLGRSAEASSDVQQLMSARPSDPSVLMVAAQWHLAEGRPAEAIAPLEAAAAVQPEDPALWVALGHARAEAGAMPAARAALEQALRLEPRAPQVLRRLAAVCLALGDSAAAGAALERLRALPAPTGGTRP